MVTALVTRLLSMVPVLLGIAIIAFFLIRLVPGDIVTSMMGENRDAQLEVELRRLFGLDRPLPIQFADWFTALLRGDLGHSMRTGRPVTTEVLERFPMTLELTAAALIVSLAISIPFGILSATRRNTSLDLGARILSLIGLSMPNFWLGILLIMVCAVYLRILPSGGYAAPTAGPWEHLRFLIMPAVTLGASLAAVTMRMTRSSLLEVLGEDYVRTARAKGLRETSVVLRHALRNSLIPVVTILGIQTGRLLGGTVIVEEVFAWPGLGSLVVRSIYQRDYPMVQGLTIFLAFFFVLVSFLVDVFYVYLDPRLRRG